MAIIRDEVCANRVGLLAEMGAMEEELLVFGCCYLENGQVKYRVSSDKDEISLFQLDAVDAMDAMNTADTENAGDMPGGRSASML